jgi:hypothetical protein
MLERFLQILKGEIGYLEKKNAKDLYSHTKNPGHANYTKYGFEYGLQGQPWCAMFITWCARTAGIPEAIIPNFASCTAGINWFTKENRYVENPYRNIYIAPDPGDIIFFCDSDKQVQHVGVVIETDKANKLVYTIEGNTSAGNNTVIPNGGAVCKKKYNMNSGHILGYAKPKYINIKETTMDEKFKDLPLDHWAYNDIILVNSIGLMTGISETEFGPDIPVTRAQLAAVLARMVLIEDKEIISESNNVEF